MSNPLPNEPREPSDPARMSLACFLGTVAMMFFFTALWRLGLLTTRLHAFLAVGFLLGVPVAGTAAGIISIVRRSRRAPRLSVTAPVAGVALNAGLLALVIFTTVVRAHRNARAAIKALEAVTAAKKEAVDSYKTNQEITSEQGVALMNKMRTAFDSEAANASGRTKLILQASANYYGRYQRGMSNLIASVNRARDTGCFEPYVTEKKEDLQSKRNALKEVTEFNRQMTHLIEHAEELYREDLAGQQVDEHTIEQGLAKFRQENERTKGTLMQVRAAEADITEALLAQLDLLETNWGKWEYDEKTRGLFSQDDDFLQQYNKLKDTIDAARERENELQRKHFLERTNAPPGGSP